MYCAYQVTSHHNFFTIIISDVLKNLYQQWVLKMMNCSYLLETEYIPTMEEAIAGNDHNMFFFLKNFSKSEYE